jgi:hypothetical protein
VLAKALHWPSSGCDQMKMTSLALSITQELQ